MVSHRTTDIPRPPSRVRSAAERAASRFTSSRFTYPFSSRSSLRRARGLLKSGQANKPTDVRGIRPENVLNALCVIAPAPNKPTGIPVGGGIGRAGTRRMASHLRANAGAERSHWSATGIPATWTIRPKGASQDAGAERSQRRAGHGLREGVVRKGVVLYSQALNVIDGAAPLASRARRTNRLLTLARAAVTPAPVTRVRPPSAGV